MKKRQARRNHLSTIPVLFLPAAAVFNLISSLLLIIIVITTIIIPAQNGYNNNNNVAFVLAGGFSVTAGVGPKARPQEGEQTSHVVSMYLCDIGSGVPKMYGTGNIWTQGSVITVCIKPDRDGVRDGLKMRSIENFYWTRYEKFAGTMKQTAIEDGVSDNELTSFDDVECRGKEYCQFSTILNSLFFLTDGRVTGTGVATLQLGTQDDDGGVYTVSSPSSSSSAAAASGGESGGEKDGTTIDATPTNNNNNQQQVATACTLRSCRDRRDLRSQQFNDATVAEDQRVRIVISVQSTEKDYDGLQLFSGATIQFGSSNVASIVVFVTAILVTLALLFL